MKVLLTGARGLLGHAMQRACPENWKLVALGHSDLDILEPAAIQMAITAHQPTAVVNCAAYTAVDLAETEVDRALAANATGPAHLARATAAAGVPLVQISTDFVFDGAQTGAYLESDPVAPLSVYGLTKAIGERAVREHQPDHLIVRTAWLYGDTPPGFPHLLLQLARKHGELRVVTDQQGSPTYAPHLAAGIFHALKAKVRGTLHLAGGGSASRYEWALALMNALNHSTPVTRALSSDFPTAATRPPNSTLSSEHPSGLALAPWIDGLEEFVRSLENPT